MRRVDHRRQEPVQLPSDLQREQSGTHRTTSARTLYRNHFRHVKVMESVVFDVIKYNPTVRIWKFDAMWKL